MLPLESEHYYHVYNRANGWERILTCEENYRFFLQRYQKLVSPYVNTLCYCLMPNHFHLLIQPKQKNEIVEMLNDRKELNDRVDLMKSYESDPDKFLSKQFSNFFSSYTQAFNKQNSRMGSLFMKNFKRKRIHDEEYFKNLVHYIHFNPVDAGLCQQMDGWKHSSYRSILTGTTSNLINIQEVHELFGSLDDFKSFHSRQPSIVEPE